MTITGNLSRPCINLIIITGLIIAVSLGQALGVCVLCGECEIYTDICIYAIYFGLALNFMAIIPAIKNGSAAATAPSSSGLWVWAIYLIGVFVLIDNNLRSMLLLIYSCIINANAIYMADGHRRQLAWILLQQYIQIEYNCRVKCVWWLLDEMCG